MNNDIEKIFNALSLSKFRSSFKLKNKDLIYIKEKGLDKIKEHAYKFVEDRLASAHPSNDGKQTPMKGHPVFIAQHATATCCRSCLYKWHKIKPNKELSQVEKNYIVNFIIKWIVKQIKNIA